MTDTIRQLEKHRKEYEESVTSVAESMRNCVEMAEKFAKSLRNLNLIPMANGNGLDAKGKRKAGTDEPEERGKRKRVTKPKDPNAPKRPATSFLLYQNSRRPDVKKAHPEMSHSEIMTAISQEWSAISAEDKAEWIQKSEVEKAKYDVALKAYAARSPEEVAAADAATAAALAEKKKPRAKKTPVAKAAPVPVVVASASEQASSDDEEESSDDDKAPVAQAATTDDSEEDSDAESSEEEEAPPAKKPKHAAAGDKKKR
ncbi:high mobility group box domain-containing protein [Mycena floridula]|nr:high mobility group box domain-containing protein [Mycena floridula]